jgi:hypothetical protein
MRSRVNTLEHLRYHPRQMAQSIHRSSANAPPSEETSWISTLGRVMALTDEELAEEVLWEQPVPVFERSRRGRRGSGHWGGAPSSGKPQRRRVERRGIPAASDAAAERQWREVGESASSPARPRWMDGERCGTGAARNEVAGRLSAMAVEGARGWGKTMADGERAGREPDRWPLYVKWLF